jgi:UDPglucose--hexose-1-phosphate uridylyltransferase
MPELRKDLLSEIWVVIAPERKLRPQFSNLSGEDFLSPENCPFCEGNESMTPPEIYAVRNSQNKPNQPGWQLRVVPNKFPALRVEGDLEKRGEGLYDKITGIGAHEVVIETNSHTKGIDELDLKEVVDIFLTFKRRILDLKQDIRFRYIQVFKNHGVLTGSTISHPHSQIIALPIVPARVKERLEHAELHYRIKDRCIFCDILHYESEYHKRVLFESSDYIVLAPYASRLPFELVIYPKTHNASFEETDDPVIASLAIIIQESIGKINKRLERPNYSLILHNASFDRNCSNYFHWHLEIIPTIFGIGGLTLGTYSYINPISPEKAINILREQE